VTARANVSLEDPMMYLLRRIGGRDWQLVPVRDEQGEAALERQEQYVFKSCAQAHAVLANLRAKERANDDAR